MLKLIKESKDNWEAMPDIIAGVAPVVRENIRGRHDGILQHWNFLVRSRFRFESVGRRSVNIRTWKGWR